MWLLCSIRPELNSVFGGRSSVGNETNDEDKDSHYEHDRRCDAKQEGQAGCERDKKIPADRQSDQDDSNGNDSPSHLSASSSEKSLGVG